MTYYFLKRLYLFLIGFFIAVVSILSLGDLLVRLTLLPSLHAIPIILFLMLPLMGVFAIPLATSIGTHILTGKLCDNNEVLLIHYLPRLKFALFKTVGIFSLSLLLLYVPLVCEWAPRTYFRGKKYMVTLVQERLLQLEPGKFHTFLSAFSLYFQRKESISSGTRFVNLIIKSKFKDRPFIAIAQQGIFDGDILKLHEGTLLSVDQEKRYIVSFEDTEINLSTFWETNSGSAYLGEKDPKYMSWEEIKVKKHTGNSGARAEFHVRIARILWQLLFPFISLMIMLSLCRVGGNNLLLSFASGLGLMLVSYINVSMAQALKAQGAIFFVALYGVMIVYVSVVIFLYRRRKL